MKIEKTGSKCKTCKIKFNSLSDAEHHKTTNITHKVRVYPTLNRKDIRDLMIFFAIEIIIMFAVIEYIAFPIAEEKKYIIDCSFSYWPDEICKYTEEYEIARGNKVNA